MKRTPLSIGSTIQAKGSSSYTYIIDRVIGDGARSIVYEAHYEDHSNHKHYIRLKECYPYQSSIARNGNNLVWSNENERTNDIVAFKSGYDALMKDQKSNYIVHAFDQFESNNTMYIVMDANEGVTFDKTDFDSLKDILSTIKLLAHVVGEYHQKGYLHLDIKPSNFLVYPRPSEHIVLFDVDSVTLKDDIKNKKIKCVSYSKGWAAPEQMQGRVEKLCPATDIFSIGAILFQKVMGRAVENEDIGIFADWDFEGELFDDVNPTIKRLLREIFKNTLAANIKRRYQTANELISALDEARKVAEQEVYLVNEDVFSEINFVGREKELANMHDLFSNGTKAIFLHGFGGVGKTALARRFAELYADDYDCIQFHRYINGLSTIIDEDMVNVVSEDPKSHRKQLRKICNASKTLIIIDNFDDKKDGDGASLDYLLSLNANFIFTTRKDYYTQYVSSGKATALEMDSLPTDELITVFTNEYGASISKDEEELVDLILKRFGNLTMIVTIIVKQIIASAISIKDFATAVEQHVFARLDEKNEDINIKKDGKYKKTNSLDFIRDVFNIADLSDGHKLVLKYLYLLKNRQNLTVQEYRDLTGQINLNILNDLQYRSWISYVKTVNGIEIKVHQLVYDLVENDWRPHATSCREFLDHITKNLKITDQYSTEMRANWRHKKHIEQAVNRKAATSVVQILSLLDYTDVEDVNYVVNFFYTCFDGDLYKGQYCLCEELFEILTKLINVWQATENQCAVKLNSVIIFLFILYCMGTENEYRGEDDVIPEDVQSVINIMKATIDYFQNTVHPYNKQLLFDFLKPYLEAQTNTEIWLQLDSDFSFECRGYVVAHADLLNDLREFDAKLINRFMSRCKDHSLKTNETPNSKEKLEQSLAMLHQQPIHVLLTSLEDASSNKVAAIQNVLSNPAISVEEKNNLIEFAFLNIFFPFCGQTQVKLKERNRIDWKQYIEPLMIHADYFDQKPFSTKRDGGKFDLSFNISRCRLAYIFALTNDYRTSETLEQVFLQISLRHLSQEANAWWNDKTSVPRFYVDFDRMINVFYNIDKSYLILPYTIKYAELVKNNLPENMGNEVLFEWYERIIQCAEDAYKQKKDKCYLETIEKYEQLIKQMLIIK